MIYLDCINVCKALHNAKSCYVIEWEESKWPCIRNGALSCFTKLLPYHWFVNPAHWVITEDNGGSDICSLKHPFWLIKGLCSLHLLFSTPTSQLKGWDYSIVWLIICLPSRKGGEEGSTHTHTHKNWCRFSQAGFGQGYSEQKGRLHNGCPEEHFHVTLGANLKALHTVPLHPDR